jgi:hypothetical protein
MRSRTFQIAQRMQTGADYTGNRLLTSSAHVKDDPYMRGYLSDIGVSAETSIGISTRCPEIATLRTIGECGGGRSYEFSWG